MVYVLVILQGGGGRRRPSLRERDRRVSAAETLSGLRHHHDTDTVSTRYRSLVFFLSGSEMKKTVTHTSTVSCVGSRRRDGRSSMSRITETPRKTLKSDPRI